VGLLNLEAERKQITCGGSLYTGLWKSTRGKGSEALWQEVREKGRIKP
jgi:hypothetical protein